MRPRLPTKMTATTTSRTTPTLTSLQPIFDELRARLVTATRQQLRPSGAGVAVHFAVGEYAWLIDLRDGVSSERAIRRLDAALAVEVKADVSVTIPNPADLQLLLLKRLSPFRALSLKRVVLSGELRQLHQMEWLMRAGQADGALSIRVVETAVINGHGVYRVRVEEGAACWSVQARWSELRQLSTTLNDEYGKGSPLNLALPKLRGSSMSSSAASKTLERRTPRIEAYLRAVVAKLGCSPRAAQARPPAAVRAHAPAHPRAQRQRPAHARDRPRPSAALSARARPGPPQGPKPLLLHSLVTPVTPVTSVTSSVT